MSKEKIYSVIVAAGTGKRMNSTVKKQYMEIDSRPVLFYTLKAFEASGTDEIIIVTGEDEIDFVQKEIVDKYGIKKVSKICAGGKERCDSVYEGIKQIRKNNDESAYVLIHDGVRPLVTPELINFCIENVKESGACVPGIPEKDTVKEAGADMCVSDTPDRKKLYRIQTPQCFSLSLISEAFEKYCRDMDSCRGTEPACITDDSMLVEKYTGHKVKIIEGDHKNIKITTPEDLELFDFFWRNRDGR